MKKDTILKAENFFLEQYFFTKDNDGAFLTFFNSKRSCPNSFMLIYVKEKLTKKNPVFSVHLLDCSGYMDVFSNAGHGL